jgi:molybdate transport system regulatory protein
MTHPDLQLSQALGHEVSDKRIDILRQVAQVGSISEAARIAGVSYKAAWQAIETLGNLAGQPLVEKVVGGVGGGGAQLSTAGHRLLDAADRFAQARATVLAGLRQEAGIGLPAAGLLSLGLRTSMRNQLPCTVVSLSTRGNVVRVALGLSHGAVLHARITVESAELLGLRPNLPALALCKATAVRVERSGTPQEGSNVLHGRVQRTSSSDLDCEVSLQLNPELHLVGFAPEAFEGQTGESAVARVDEAAIVIAVSA